MKDLTSNIKLKIAAHSFLGPFYFFIILFVNLFLFHVHNRKYIFISLLMVIIIAALSILFNRTKYLISININEYSIRIEYLTPLLAKKSAEVDKTNLTFTEISGTSNLGIINFHNRKQNLSLSCIDKKLKNAVLNLLEE